MYNNTAAGELLFAFWKSLDDISEQIVDTRFLLHPFNQIFLTCKQKNWFKTETKAKTGLKNGKNTFDVNKICHEQ